MRYEEFFTPDEVATFKRVHNASMTIAAVSREQAAALVGGRVLTGAKEFVQTELGYFRMSNRGNSDNRTEQREHERLGARSVVMDGDELVAWFELHGLDGPATVAEFKDRVRGRLL